MSRGTNQKFKLLYLMEIMQEKTDEEHALTLRQIKEELEKYDVTAERKSIYTDLEDMERFGIEILKEQRGRETYYHVASRKFELAEVKLLVDAIQSSKFITLKKSRELIAKLKSFVSKNEANLLQRQLFIDGRVKTMNESVFYNVDEIYKAINDNKKIRFKYYKWDINKKLVPRHGDEWFVVSPWALTWMEENYYMVAYDEWAGKMKNYRVDKMMKISITDEKREGKKEFDNFDMANLSKSTFSMFDGDRERVKLRFDNSICGVFLDRFGKDDISFRKVDDDHSEVTVEVSVSPQFYGWIFGLGDKVKVVGPENVVKELKKYAGDFLKSMG